MNTSDSDAQYVSVGLNPLIPHGYTLLDIRYASRSVFSVMSKYTQYKSYYKLVGQILHNRLFS